MSKSYKHYDQIACIELTTFKGITPGASHYYATIKKKGDHYIYGGIEVRAPLSAKDALALNKEEAENGISGYQIRYKPGEKTSRIHSRAQAIKASIKAHKKAGLGKTHPILCVTEGTMPLQATEIVWMKDKELMEKLNGIWRQAEAAYELSDDPWEDVPGFQLTLDSWDELVIAYLNNLKEAE